LLIVGCKVALGKTVEIGYSAQTREELDNEKTVYEEMCDGEELIQIGSNTLHVRQYLSAFNFKGPAQEKKVGSLRSVLRRNAFA